MADDTNRTDVQLHLLILRGGIEPELWGPYSSDEERREEARTLGSGHDSVVLIDAPGPIDVETLGSWEYV